MVTADTTRHLYTPTNTYIDLREFRAAVAATRAVSLHSQKRYMMHHPVMFMMYFMDNKEGNNTNMRK